MGTITNLMVERAARMRGGGNRSVVEAIEPLSGVCLLFEINAPRGSEPHPLRQSVAPHIRKSHWENACRLATALWLVPLLTPFWVAGMYIDAFRPLYRNDGIVGHPVDGDSGNPPG